MAGDLGGKKSEVDPMASFRDPTAMSGSQGGPTYLRRLEGFWIHDIPSDVASVRAKFDLKSHFGLNAHAIAHGCGALPDRIRDSDAGPGNAAPLRHGGWAMADRVRGRVSSDVGRRTETNVTPIRQDRTNRGFGLNLKGLKSSPAAASWT